MRLRLRELRRIIRESFAEPEPIRDEVAFLRSWLDAHKDVFWKASIVGVLGDK